MVDQQGAEAAVSALSQKAAARPEANASHGMHAKLPAAVVEQARDDDMRAVREMRVRTGTRPIVGKLKVVDDDNTERQTRVLGIR
eukprot:gene16964-biopygen11039